MRSQGQPILGLKRSWEWIMEDGTLFRDLFRMAIPISVQNLLVTSLNMVDIVMIGQLGPVQIGAVAVANQVYFLLMLFLFGVGSGTAVFTAQYWGKRDVAGIRAAMGLGLSVGMAGALAFSVAATIAPEGIIAIYSTDPAVIRYGGQYLSIVSLSYLATAVSVIFGNVLRSTGNVRLPLLATSISLGLNTLFNYILIFGHFGLPAMGVRGAAIATVFARAVETTIVLTATYRRGEPAAARLKELFNMHWPFVKRFVVTTAPVVLNEIGWSLGMTMYTFVYAHMGTEIIAAYNVADTAIRLSFVLFFGTGNATAILIGNMIGAGRVDHAQRYADRLLVVMPIVGMVVGIVLFAVSGWLPLLFNIGTAGHHLATTILRIHAVLVPIKVANMHIIVGLLRSGGDTRYGLILELSMMWSLGVSLALLAGLVWHLPAPLVYLMTGTEEIGKAVFGIRRVLSGRWIHQITADKVLV
jgi:putative MATE family efflux protein